MASDRTALLAATQTLTNKTLTSPTLTDAALNGDLSGTAFLDEDDLSSDSATKLASQQSIKAYIDSGSVTMTNKTFTSPVINTQITGTAMLDEDDMASDSPTKVASQQSIKAYIDNEKSDILDGTDPITSLNVDGTGDISSTLDIGSSTTRRVSPGSIMVTQADGYPSLSTTELDVDSNIGGTFESVGPSTGTGSGKTNDWTALNGIPVDAAYIWVYVIGVFSDSGASEASLYARENGSSVAVNATSKIAYAAADADGSMSAVAQWNHVYPIPVYERSFDLAFSSNFSTANTVQLRLLGCGFAVPA